MGALGKISNTTKSLNEVILPHADGRSAAFILCTYGVTNWNDTDCCLLSFLKTSETSLSSQRVAGSNPLLANYS